MRAGVANETPGISRCSRLPSNDNVHRTNAQWSRKHRDPTVFRKNEFCRNTPLSFRVQAPLPPGLEFFSFFFSLGGEKYDTRVHSPSLTCPCRARACSQKLTGPQHTLVRDKKLGRMPFLYRRGLSGVFTCVCLACIYVRRCVSMFDTCTFARARSPSCQFVVVLWIETEIRDILRVGKGRGPVVCSD